jgi:hypothetical protein
MTCPQCREPLERDDEGDGWRGTHCPHCGYIEGTWEPRTDTASIKAGLSALSTEELDELLIHFGTVEGNPDLASAVAKLRTETGRRHGVAHFVDR